MYVVHVNDDSSSFTRKAETAPHFISTFQQNSTFTGQDWANRLHQGQRLSVIWTSSFHNPPLKIPGCPNSLGPFHCENRMTWILRAERKSSREPLRVLHPSKAPACVACLVLPGTNQASGWPTSGWLVATLCYRSLLKGQWWDVLLCWPGLIQVKVWHCLRKAMTKDWRLEKVRQLSSLKPETLRCITELNWNLSNMYIHIYIYYYFILYYMILWCIIYIYIYPQPTVQYLFHTQETSDITSPLVAAHQKNAIHLPALVNDTTLTCGADM